MFRRIYLVAIVLQLIRSHWNARFIKGALIRGEYFGHHKYTLTLRYSHKRTWTDRTIGIEVWQRDPEEVHWTEH